ncbi:hypothetical protein APF79_07015 [bacterium BRH_c32]|nr:MAG: hypothetical protein APF79_13895 [bacterium BRH_c32]KUO63517.1 MAG: hypothetical protein APF79_07015 [bacterium BRH_c32]
MKKNLSKIKYLFLVCFSFLLMFGHLIKAQEIKSAEMPKHKHDIKEVKMTEVADSSVIRKGVIDLKAIDKNKDGKVFQDQMDWNVISDTPGRCPICKMPLSEVTLERARQNLKDAGLKVKEKPVPFKKK